MRQGRFSTGTWAAIVLIASTLRVASAAPEAMMLPYRAEAIVVDGVLDEWDAARPYEAHFDETTHAPAARNRVRARLAWDERALYFAFEVDDNDMVAAPANLAVDQFHQYDSLQVYIDPRDDSARSMNRDDVDVILLPDGRHGVLRGDDLVAALTDAAVPQRESTPLLADYVARRTATGWRAELAIPFAGLGVSAQASHRLRIDVTMNDWLVDHPPGASEAFDAERVRAGEVPLAEPVDPAVGTQLLPLAWSGERDFGFPPTWRVFALQGEAPWLEAQAARHGVAMVASMAAFGAMAVLSGVALVIAAWRRRQLRALMRRLESWPTTARIDASALRRLSMSSSMAAAAESSAASQRSEGVEQGSDAPSIESSTTIATTQDANAPILTEDESPSTEPDPSRDRAFCERVLAHIRAHLDQAHTPAQLAEQFHVSPRTLQRRLKSGMGTSPRELVLAARLQVARELLAQGQWRVSDVANRVGFDDLSHFSRRFRAAYGVAPSQARDPAAH